MPWCEFPAVGSKLNPQRRYDGLGHGGLSSYRAVGGVASTTSSLVDLAEAYAKLRHPNEGLGCLTEAEQIVETTDERYHAAELYRLRGDLHNISGDTASAEQDYRRAHAVAKRQSAKLFELRASTSLARLWRDQGKRIEAHDILAPIYDWFTEGFDAPDLMEARALPAELAPS
jgi:predicted ATPase